MRKLILSLACVLSLGAMAQDKVAADTLAAAPDSTKHDSCFVFTTIKENPITRVKNQHRSGTCWSFSGIGFLESELLRMGKGEMDLSEMFIVHKTMLDRAVYCVRMYGDVKFAAGGSSEDILYCLANYGVVPQEAMPGIAYGASEADTLPVHKELDALAGAYVRALTHSDLSKLTPVWKNGLVALYDTYLGACPEEFTYNGKKYTPVSFAESLGLKATDYVALTSYTHHPFYTQFALEVPDNWRMGLQWNVPIDEMMQVIDEAIENGYTLMWSADVSEIGFTRDGIGVVPDVDRGADLTGTDMANWVGLSNKEKGKKLTEYPLPEKEITQEMRQQAYDNWENTDDHGMQIFGIAHDQNGKKYYMVKNSWGTEKSKYKGIWYISEAYMRYKTNEIVVHKDAINKQIRKKIDVK